MIEILAIRTAKWKALFDEKMIAVDLDRGIEHSAHLANRVLSKLMSTRSVIFPSKKQPWYQANDEDVLK